MPKALEAWGFSTVDFVQKQIVPNGNFPTVKFPNPEYSEALELGIQQLKETKAEVLIATDPDADRMGAVVKHRGKSVILTGNELASLYVYFLCETLSQQKKMPKNGAFVTTIVTTDLLQTIAKAYGKSCFETLTGFKYIGAKIREWETSKNYTFLFGAEESYGFLLGTHARDKDGIVAGCFLCEIALQMKLCGKTVIDLLYDIYQKFGIYRQKQLLLSVKEGASFMQKLRSQLPFVLAGQKVVKIDDLMPSSDVLIFRLADASKMIVRPSGTEPKVKIYFFGQEKKNSAIEEGIRSCDRKLDFLTSEAQRFLQSVSQ